MLACQRLSSNINSGGRPHNLGSLWCGQQLIFFVQNFTQMWKTLWGKIPTKAFLLKNIWKNSPIGDKNKSNETYKKDFCEKGKNAPRLLDFKDFFCWSCNM
jgi:hypothetical protein